MGRPCRQVWPIVRQRSRRASLVFISIPDTRTGGVLVRPIGISPLPILMARRSHCLRRLTAFWPLQRSDCDWTQVSRFLYFIRQTSHGPPAAWALSLLPLPEDTFPSGNSSHGGPVTGYIHPSYSGILLFSFQVARRLVLTSGQCGPRYYCLS